MCIVPEAKGGRAALSYVRLLACNQELSLLEVRPRTGRTHQIRVHLAEEHTPVLGDAFYGGAKANRRYLRFASRAMLHAFRLEFQHPATGQAMSVEAPLPSDMRELLEQMQAEAPDAELVKYILETADRSEP